MIRTRRLLVPAIVAIVVADAVTLAYAAPADPPVPRLVKVAGTLPGVTGAATVRFAIYAEQASDVPLWAETQRVAVDEGGRFAVYLGASQHSGLPIELFATGNTRWLGVQADGQAEQARVLLVSVPYALKAADADTVGGKPLSAFVLAGTTTGTAADGLTYVDARVIKSGLSGAGALPQGAGTANYIGMFTDTTNLGNSVIYQNGTSIGVGTTSPAAAFHSVATAAPGALFDVYSNALGALPVVFRAARGTPASPTAVQTDDILGGLAVRGYGATGFTTGRGQVMFKAAENWTDSANGTYLQFTTTPIGSGVWTERMRITPAGSVGIGTATPAQTLSVVGVIESTTGGFKFPDGTTQASAVSLAANTFTGTQTISGGNLALPMTTGATAGVLTLGGQSFLHAFGGATNTFVGGQAGGGFATTGLYNSAFGASSLYANTTGEANAAFGTYSLYANTIGNYNVAVGVASLQSNTTGSSNTAFGTGSLAANTTASTNAAFGESSLTADTTGFNNAAFGGYSLYANTTGANNVAVGYASLVNTTGSNNIAVGTTAGSQLTTGNNNIDIGNLGVVAEADTIRIGTVGTQTRTFVSGIRGYTTGSANAVAVLIDSNGQLGTVSSSRRVKDDIADMDAASRALMTLRPVTFHYKTDQNPSGRTLQYGLIAEEVAEVYPGLVARSADGQIETVMYQFLPPMLLNEYQRQQRTIEALRARVETGDAEMRTRDEQIRTLTAQVAAGDAQMRTRDEQTRRLADQVAALTRAVAALGDRRQ